MGNGLFFWSVGLVIKMSKNPLKKPNGAPNHCPYCGFLLKFDLSFLPTSFVCPNCREILWGVNCPQGIWWFDHSFISNLVDFFSNKFGAKKSDIINKLNNLFFELDSLDLAEIVLKYEELNDDQLSLDLFFDYLIKKVEETR